MRKPDYLFLFFIIGFLSGCGFGTEYLDPETDIAEQSEVQTVSFPSKNLYNGAPSTLAIALTWSGIKKSPQELATEMLTLKDNEALQTAIQTIAHRNGRIAYLLPKSNDLLVEIAAGYPVITLQNKGLSGYPVWQYSIITGYDGEAGNVTLYSGSASKEKLPFADFETSWAKSKFWGVAILPPDQIPATATVESFVTALNQLENAGKNEESVTGYQAALKKWPKNLTLLMGLGDNLNRQKKAREAEAVYRQVVDLFPNFGSAYHNLAKILHQQGNQKEAVAMINQAIALEDPLVQVYKKTLEKIKQKR